MTSNNVDQLPERGTAEHVPVTELARRQSVGPVTSVDDLARPDLFESDEELADFLADLYATRHTGRDRVSAEASELVSIPRAELESLKAEVKRLRREVGRGVARTRIEADRGPGDDALTFTREQLAEAWGIGE
jgi:hypothetical protein